MRFLTADEILSFYSVFDEAFAKELIQEGIEKKEREIAELEADKPEGYEERVGDLRESLNNDIDSFTLTVVNTYQSPRTFTINSSDSSHFRITNASGNDYGSITLGGGETQTYTVYVGAVAALLKAVSLAKV